MAGTVVTNGNSGIGYKEPQKYDTAKEFIMGKAALARPYYDKMNFDKPNQVSMDFGCGTGMDTVKSILPLFIGSNPTLYGVDISKECIATAQKSHAHPNIQYLAANILSPNFPLKEQSLDSIVSNQALQHIVEWRQALNGLYKLLKPGGSFGAFISTEPGVFKIYKRLKAHPDLGIYMKGLEVMDWVDEPRSTALDLYRRELISVGYQVEWMELSYRKITYELDKFVDFYISFNPLSCLVPTHLEEAYKQIYKDELSTWTSTESISFVAQKKFD